MVVFLDFKNIDYEVSTITCYKITFFKHNAKFVLSLKTLSLQSYHYVVDWSFYYIVLNIQFIDSP